MLPKVKAPLNLVAEVETDELREKRRRWREQQELRDRLLAEEESKGSNSSAAAAAASSSSSASLLPGADDLTATTANALATGSPRPFAFSLPSAPVVDLDLQQLDDEVAAAASSHAAADASHAEAAHNVNGAAGSNGHHLTDSDHD